MRRAHSEVQLQDAAPPATSYNDTGTGFMVGLADRGPTTGQLTDDDVLTSLGDWITGYGARQSYNGPEADTVEAFFTDGGTRLYFARYVGPAAAKAQITVPSSSPQGTFKAKSEGAWANGGTITITAGVATIVAGGVTETSPTLTTVGDLVDWVAGSDVVDYTPSVALTTALSNSTARTLASGADDRASAGDTQRAAALARFSKDLGPGDVAMPGVATVAAYTAIAQHCENMGGIRFGYGDAPDAEDVDTVAAVGLAVRALGTTLARHIQILEPWITGPPLDGSARTCPPCGMQMGMAARNDSVNPPSRAVAFRNGISRFAQGVKYSRTDDELDQLADSGVTAIRSIRGVVQTYDDITPVDQTVDPEWGGAAGNRMIMRIIVDALEIADAHLGATVSGLVDLDAFNGDLKGMLGGWLLKGSLFSEDGSAAKAFRVETGPAVNTPTTLAARQLRAALALKLSQNVREVIIPITNTPLQSAL